MNHGSRRLFSQDFAYAQYRTTRSIGHDKVIQVTVMIVVSCKSLQNFRPRRLLMDLSIGLIFKLIRPKVAMLVGQFLGLNDHASALF